MQQVKLSRWTPLSVSEFFSLVLFLYCGTARCWCTWELRTWWPRPLSPMCNTWTEFLVPVRDYLSCCGAFKDWISRWKILSFSHSFLQIITSLRNSILSLSSFSSFICNWHIQKVLCSEFLVNFQTMCTLCNVQIRGTMSISWNIYYCWRRETSELFSSDL